MRGSVLPSAMVVLAGSETKPRSRVTLYGTVSLNELKRRVEEKGRAGKGRSEMIQHVLRSSCRNKPSSVNKPYHTHLSVCTFFRFDPLRGHAFRSSILLAKYAATMASATILYHLVRRRGGGGTIVLEYGGAIVCMVVFLSMCR